MSGRANDVSEMVNSLKEMFNSSNTWHEPTIFRHDYEPEILSIGPFHRGKDHLQKMEQEKLRYLKLLLIRENETIVGKCVEAMMLVEEEARKCYAGPVGLSKDEFVVMLVIDGCFILELIRKYSITELRKGYDNIISNKLVLDQLRHDLLLLGNQLPFFVLDHLFDMTKTDNSDDIFLDLIQHFFNDISPWPKVSPQIGEVSMEGVDHLLSIVYRVLCSSFPKITGNRRVGSDEEQMLFIDSATKLQEVGIKFKRCTKSDGLDIKFLEGTMEMPGLLIWDKTESILRSLVEYEQRSIRNHPRYVSDYAYVWFCLLKTSKDVQVLRSSGILMHVLKNDDSVYAMFGRLYKIMKEPSKFTYEDVYEKVTAHCSRRRNKWTEILWPNFDNPRTFTWFFIVTVFLFYTIGFYFSFYRL